MSFFRLLLCKQGVLIMVINSVFGEYCTNELIYAAFRGDIEGLEDCILEGKLDINDTDDSGYTALDYAIERRTKL